MRAFIFDISEELPIWVKDIENNRVTDGQIRVHDRFSGTVVYVYTKQNQPNWTPITYRDRTIEIADKTTPTIIAICREEFQYVILIGSLLKHNITGKSYYKTQERLGSIEDCLQKVKTQQVNDEVQKFQNNLQQFDTRLVPSTERVTYEQCMERVNSSWTPNVLISFSKSFHQTEARYNKNVSDNVETCELEDRKLYEGIEIADIYKNDDKRFHHIKQIKKASGCRDVIGQVSQAILYLRKEKNGRCAKYAIQNDTDIKMTVGLISEKSNLQTEMTGAQRLALGFTMCVFHREGIDIKLAHIPVDP